MVPPEVGELMSEKTTNEEYLEMIRKVAAEKGRLPKKSDFSPLDVNRIKGFFGPWPWALEAAGLRESSKEKKQRNYMRKQGRNSE